MLLRETKIIKFPDTFKNDHSFLTYGKGGIEYLRQNIYFIKIERLNNF